MLLVCVSLTCDPQCKQRDQCKCHCGGHICKVLLNHGYQSELSKPPKQTSGVMLQSGESIQHTVINKSSLSSRPQPCTRAHVIVGFWEICPRVLAFQKWSKDLNSFQKSSFGVSLKHEAGGTCFCSFIRSLNVKSLCLKLWFWHFWEHGRNLSVSTAGASFG